ncbi:MAG TPA: sensor histidine kinase [Blastocatellia bacterium]|nr:sensor histidine kinase [Blastocatellia bacterium]
MQVEDDGPGFAHDVKLHLVENRVKGPESKGHGLGLAFVDAFVRTHGGTVTAANRDDGGRSDRGDHSVSPEQVSRGTGGFRNPKGLKFWGRMQALKRSGFVPNRGLI